MEGIHRIKPVIKKVRFEKKGMICIYLQDGRIIYAPLSLFPSIRRIPAEQRNKYSIVNDQMIMFRYGNEIYHLQDFLGKEQEYIYRG
jgi:hypothetical protein